MVGLFFDGNESERSVPAKRALSVSLPPVRSRATWLSKTLSEMELFLLWSDSPVRAKTLARFNLFFLCVCRSFPTWNSYGRLVSSYRRDANASARGRVNRALISATCGGKCVFHSRCAPVQTTRRTRSHRDLTKCRVPM